MQYEDDTIHMNLRRTDDGRQTDGGMIAIPLSGGSPRGKKYQKVF